MFIRRLGSRDERFRTLAFRDGLNILVADRTETSEQGDSRNSIGKSSFVRILRYLLGSNLPEEFKIPELQDHVFFGVFNLPAVADGATDEVLVHRWVTPTTRLSVGGWSRLIETGDVHIDVWR